MIFLLSLLCTNRSSIAHPSEHSLSFSSSSSIAALFLSSLPPSLFHLLLHRIPFVKWKGRARETERRKCLILGDHCIRNKRRRERKKVSPQSFLPLSRGCMEGQKIYTLLLAEESNLRSGKCRRRVLHYSSFRSPSSRVLHVVKFDVMLHRGGKCRVNGRIERERQSS